MSQINLNYCVQCHSIDIERVYNCRWLNLNFCCLKCLQQFYDRIASKCDICKKQLNYNRIHLRDDVKNNNLFICDECFVQRKPLAVHCHYCMTKCYKGFGTMDLTTSGLISKYVCSDECKILSLSKDVESKRLKLSTCSQCGCQVRKCAQAVQNESICSTKCLEIVEQIQATKFAICYHCSSKFTNNYQNEYTIREGATVKGFCTKICMQSHFRLDTKTVICCICHHRMRFYESIHRICDDRNFCSLQCSIAAETGIELLRRNDERCHMKSLNLKCATCNPELEFDDSIEDCVLFDELTVTTSDQVSEREHITVTVNKRSGKEISNQFQPYDDIEKLMAAPKLQECDRHHQCSHCQRSIKLTESFMQWERLEFCNNICYERFMYEDNFRCASCARDSSSCSIGINVQIVGNRMYYFCSDMCEKTFFELMKFCRFCRNVITSMNHSDGFCQSVCRMRFKQLYENCDVRREATKKTCYQCQLEKPVNIFLRVDGIIYDFCSFPCYFHLKTSYGFFTDQCTICQMYFVRNSNEDSSWLLRHNIKLLTFCSQSCQAHYIYKYQSLETCTICSRPKSNFNMLKSHVDDVSTIQVKYCSMQCLQIVNQSIELRKAYVNGSPPNETSLHFY